MLWASLVPFCRCEQPAYYERFTEKDTIQFCLRVMVASVILYDHVHLVGAFKKGSQIEIKATIKVLKFHQGEGAEGESFTNGLMNALRYTTKHLNDEDTPKAIKALLA